MSELQQILSWLLNLLTWLPVLVLVLVTGFFFLLLRLLFRGSSSSSSSNVVLPPGSNQRGLPTKYYTTRAELVNFNTSPKLYDFKVPSPTPDLSKLREPLKVNLQVAKGLFVANPSLDEEEEVELPRPIGPDWEMAKKLFVPRWK